MRPRDFSVKDEPVRVLEFFDLLWESTQGNAIFSCGQLVPDADGVLRGHGWHDHIFQWPEQRDAAREYLAGEAICSASEGVGWNTYYCPTLFNQRKRHKDYALPTRWLWSDLDEAHPSTFPEGVPAPTILIETSTDRYQGLWRLGYHVEPLRAQSYSRGIAYATGGDKSGWDITQLLRVPGTANGKYRDVTVQIADVQYCMDSDKSGENPTDLLTFDPSTFILLIGQQATTPGDGEAMELLAEATKLDGRALLNTKRETIRPRVLTLLTTPPQPGDDRSKRLFEIHCLLAEAGLSPAEVYTITRDCPWNKFVGRRDEEIYLAKDVLKAWMHVRNKREDATGEIVYDKAGASIFDELSDAPPDPRGLFVDAVTFLETPIESPGWMIDQIWPAVEQGIVSGTNGTLKSFFALDAAISIATGTPCLGQFEVLRQGKVLFIQEEVENWTMQDRIRRIALARGVHPDQIGNGEDSPLRNLKLLNGYGMDLTSQKDKDMIDWAASIERPDLIVLDPLYLILGQANENDGSELRPIFNWLLSLKRTYQVSVMILHHTNKEGDVRGSSVLKAWMGNHIALSRYKLGVPSIRVDRKFRGYGQNTPFAVEWSLDDPGGTLYETKIESVSDVGTTADPMYTLVKDVIWAMEDISEGETYKQLARRAKLDEQLVRRYVTTIATDGFAAIRKKGGIWKVTPRYNGIGLIGEDNEDQPGLAVAN